MTEKYLQQKTKNLLSANRSWREKQELFAKKPLKLKRRNKLTTKTLTDQDEEQLCMVKSRIGRANSKVTPLDSVVSAHPQNVSLS